jgi:hypothetical protein
MARRLDALAILDCVEVREARHLGRSQSPDEVCWPCHPVDGREPGDRDSGECRSAMTGTVSRTCADGPRKHGDG